MKPRAREPDPAAWGIDDPALPPPTVGALLAAMRARSTVPSETRIVTAPPRATTGVAGLAEIVTEEGDTIDAPDQRLPGDLPLGYHRLVWRDGSQPGLLVTSPGRCHLPAPLRAWGWALQLYALRSSSSWGMGDLGDLARFASRARALGAGMTLINPLHAVAPGVPQEPSPYYPSSRLWRNPLYVDLGEVGAEADGRLDELARAGRALNARSRIERDEIVRLKLRALELVWERGVRDPAFEGFVAERGATLDGFATFQTLVERLGREPAKWPAELRHPRSAAVVRFSHEQRVRVRFHCWLQWLLERQLRGARAADIALVHDLAVGVDPAGADAWLWQDVFASGVTVGAPPDAFNSQGQDWGVLGFDPWALRAAHFEPFVQMLRASLQAGGGLRLDHVMGLWRLYWIPVGASPREGAYVRYPADELLDVVALESVRAGAFVIGEDLGTVPPGVRAELAARDMLSYRLLWFEHDEPALWPERSLAAVTNHDLPTVPGLWSGADLAAQRALGLEPDERAHAATRAHVATAAGLPPDATARDAVTAVYRLLASAPSALKAVMLEDALEVVERQNHPGTTGEWPNWSRPLPLSLDDLHRHKGVRALAHIMSSRSRPL